MNFQIYWQNCFMQEGKTSIKAASEKAAETKFNKKFGIDYMIICIVAK